MEDDEEEAVAREGEASSARSAAFRDSRSMIWPHISLGTLTHESGSGWVSQVVMLPTFFCNRITLVHFFSSSPTHLAFGSSTSKSSFSVSFLSAS